MNKYLLVVILISLMTGFGESQPKSSKSYYIYYLCGTNPIQKFKDLAKAIGFVYLINFLNIFF
jgi:hypothetical protein